MKTCTLDDFMQGIRPWISSEYIREAYIDEKENFVVRFLDGVKNVYRITDCNRSQLDSIIEKIRSNGIAFEAERLS